MLGENPVEPVQKIELIGRRRPRLVIEAAARDPEQPALPVTDSPAFGAIIPSSGHSIGSRRWNLWPASPASQQAGDGGLSGKKIAFDLQLTDLAMQVVDHLLCIVDRRRLGATRE
jgi:hypothetical protein